MKTVPINEVIEFLKNSVFYKPFIYNLKRNGSDLQSFLRYRSHYENIINDAFSWDRTIEGYDYWYAVDRLYREWYNKRSDELYPDSKKISVDEYLDWLNMVKKQNSVNFEAHPIAADEGNPFVEIVEPVNNI